MYMIRYHLLYPWHKYGGYEDLVNEKDKKYLQWVKLFNKYDLYNKDNKMVNVEELMEYYMPLVKKYIGDYLVI